MAGLVLIQVNADHPNLMSPLQRCLVHQDSTENEDHGQVWGIRAFKLPTKESRLLLSQTP